MTALAPLPTRKAEEWRYADLDALAEVWPLPEAESLVVPAGGSFARAIVQEAANGPASVARLALSVGKGAKAAVHVLNCASASGGGYSRVEIAATLHEGADFTLGGAQLGSGRQTLEIVATITHAGPGATSRQTVRSVLAGEATGTCLGKIAVARGADGTDAEQSIRAILLDRSATANAKPELEIYADDVKCAHGCAVGELDAAGLFYLESRGLPPEEAKKLMLQAFVAEAFAGAVDEDRLLALALKRLGELV